MPTTYRLQTPSQEVMYQVIDWIYSIADMMGIPVQIMLGIVWQESHYDQYSWRFSDENPADRSYGLMHLTLPTAQMMGAPYGYGKITREDLMNDPFLNLYLGGLYLLRQYERYGDWEESISAYNAGSTLKKKNGSYVNARYINNVIQSGEIILSQI